MDRPLIVAVIRECVDKGATPFSPHALTKHPLREGFTEQDAKEALRNCVVIEEYADRDRMLVCGQASAIALDPRFIGRYIHLVVRVEQNREIQVPVISMYRPDHNDWRDAYTRR